MTRDFRFKSKKEIEKLIDGAKAGSQNALGEILEFYRALMLRYCQENRVHDQDRRVHDSDLVQETYLRACENITFFEGKTAGEIETWLLAILRNVIRNIHRQDHRQKRDISREIPLEVLREIGDWVANRPDPVLEIELEEQIRQCAQARLGLAPHYQEILKMRCYEELTWKEVGTRLGCSENGARKLFQRAIDKLREKLRARSGWPEEKSSPPWN